MNKRFIIMGVVSTAMFFYLMIFKGESADEALEETLPIVEILE